MFLLVRAFLFLISHEKQSLQNLLSCCASALVHLLDLKLISCIGVLIPLLFIRSILTEQIGISCTAYLTDISLVKNQDVEDI